MCVEIDSAGEFNNIRNNPSNNYCLTADIDLSTLPGAGYLTITTFSGILDGNYHAVLGLRTQLFGTITGTVREIGLANVVLNVGNGNSSIVSDGIGLLANTNNGGAIRNVSVSGTIDAGSDYSIGGLVGYNQQGSIFQSHVAVSISADAGSAVGGLVGYNFLGTIGQGSAAGFITVGDNSRAGGLVGYNTNSITFSSASVSISAGNNVSAGGLVGHHFASQILSSSGGGTIAVGTGGNAGGLVGRNEASLQKVNANATVTGGAGSFIGGLVGNNDDGTILQCYQTGLVQAATGAGGVGGLVGRNDGFGIESISQCYGLGIIRSQSPAVTGGLVGVKIGNSTITSSYWNPTTSGVDTSNGGTPITTSALQSSLPAGFDAAVWRITPGASTPFILATGFEFPSALSTVIRGVRVYAFGAINQLDGVNYLDTPAHADRAAEAAAYTILARAIGVTRNIASLKDVAIDRFFWNDDTQHASFVGPITNFASRGPLMTLGASQPLTNANVIRPLRQDKLVVLRGKYQDGAVRRFHWLLATSFTVNETGTPDRVIASDPWTGRQVRISVSSKRVVQPTGFPLLDFKIDAYRVITLN